MDGPRSGLPSAADTGDARVIVLVPGEAVLLTSASVPTRNPVKLRRALPFALEDRLVGDVGQEHVAAGEPEPGRAGAVPAAVVARRRLDAWLSRLAEAGLEPDAVLPEPLALPRHGNRATILLDDGRAVVRDAAFAGFACEAEALPALLDPARREGAVIRRATERDEAPGDPGDAPVLEEPVLAWLAPGASRLELDLLQGEYRPRRRIRAGRRLWLTAAALFLGWGVLEVALATADYLRLSAANDRLDRRIETVFSEAFPGQPVRDPAAQMRQQLGLLTGSSVSALDLLRGVAPVIERAVNVRLESLEYRESRLLLSVKADNIGALDALRNALAASGPYRVELAAATATEQGVDGRLVVTGAGA